MSLERCVFHMRTPGNIDAQELLPLTALRDSDPTAYHAALAKYDDTPERRRLRTTTIPRLEVGWTEAIFLSPVLPSAIWAAWRKITDREPPEQEFWAIPVEDLDEAVIVDRHLTRTGDPIDPGEVTALDPSIYTARAETTERNLAWISELSSRRKQGAWFHGTPQILTATAVPLARARVIDWSHAHGQRL